MVMILTLNDEGDEEKSFFRRWCWQLWLIVGTIIYVGTFEWEVSEPDPLKCFCAPRHQISAKSAPQKAHNCDKAEFATKLCKLRKDCVNVNNEE